MHGNFLYFILLNFAKIQRKNHFWVFNFPSRSRASRSGFYPAAAVKKVTAKPQNQPPGKSSTAETSIQYIP